MAMELQTLDDILIAISRGISSSYFEPPIMDKLPSKEVVQEAKDDIKYALTNLNGGDQPEIQKTARRFQTYLSIVELLEEIPEELWLKEKDFSRALSHFTFHYATMYQEIKVGNIGKMLPIKYKLIEEKSKISTSAVVEGSGSPISRMLQVADKYIELLKLDYIEQPKI